MLLTSSNYFCLNFLAFYHLNFAASNGKVCFGTNNGASHAVYNPANASKRNTDFKVRFSNCSKVEGNLELVYLTDEEAKLDFLKTIEEVTGYVLVLSTFAKVFSLPKLRIIRGESLFRATDPETKETSMYSLYVAMNHRDNISDVGLHEMVFTSLTEISTGNVLIRDNRLLCHAEDVFWEDILADPRSKVHVSRSNTRNIRHCQECAKNCRTEHPSVMKSHCWTPRICQKLNKVICSKSCEGRCYGEKAQECCHSECAAGCHGSTNADCFFCKHYKDGDKCVSSCPPITVFDQKLKVVVPNPGGKFLHQYRCVDECPGHMLVDKGACVVFCGDGFTPGSGNKCIPCHGNCPKSCSVDDNNDWIHSKNIVVFNNCTSVRGRIQILDVSFRGDPKRNISPMSVELLNNLKHVEEVSDFVEINTQHEQLNNLNFLNKLRFIHGRNTRTSDKHRHWSLIIQSTKLKFLGLESLESINNGGVLITRNKQLCYVHTYNWSSVVKEGSEVVVIDNRDVTACEAEGDVCSEQCTTSGCTGSSNSHCKECRNFRFGNICLSKCHNNSLNIDLYRVNDTKLCSPCHHQCLQGCSGPSNKECLEGCKNFEENSTCVDRCSIGFYADDDRICRTCPELCTDGCSGNETRLGVGGCNKCHLTLLNTAASESLKRGTLFSIKCIQPYNTTHACPIGFYLDTEDKQRSNHGACKKCDGRCMSCLGPGNSISSCTCRNISEDDRCVDGCSSGFYEDQKLMRCVKCHNLCSSCLGPDAGDCTSCTGFAHPNDFTILAENISTSKINCTDVCPSGVSYVQTVGSHLVCVKREFAERSSNHLIMWIAPLFAFVIVFIIAFSLKAKFVKRKLSCDDDNSNLQNQSPANKKGKPDMTRLKLINENELRRGNIIGSGAFGTVYKGYWVPTGKKIKISVAIKVLQEENNINDGQQDSLLEEARIMASVVHPCCVHILAVCLTSPMMLVTQLMPLGCLLEYIKKNKLQIGSGLLLNWSLQIAKGMLYLEQNRIVHRDLAARNVLLQSAEHVKITDFGLAKMVDSNAGEFRSSGGKLPIKWLALESIKDRIFSHKTDVWSYGITLWELFTFGQRPYDNIAAASMLPLLEKGERLPQPEICTIDVYMVMIKCWLVDASNRPDFKELSEEFGKMAQDPGQYLSVPFDEIAKATPKQPGISHLARTPRHRPDELNQRASEEATDDSELSHTFSGNTRQPSIKTCLIQKKAKLCQKVASCKHLSNFPLEKVDSRPRWKFGRQVAPPFSRETSFTSCRYSPSPHFGKSSPKHRVHLPSQRLPQSISSPAELIYSPSTEENQRLWPVHREASGYLSPDKENRPYLQLIDQDLDRAEKNCDSSSEHKITECGNSRTKWQPTPRKNDSRMMSFDNLEYFHQNHDLT